MTPYGRKIAKLLTPAERTLFSRLNTPHKIQSFLETLKENRTGTLMSPRRTLKAKKAHCIEGALLASAILAYHGGKPLLMDFQSADDDEDHVIALFTEKGLWGALSKTSHAVLGYRDPVYKNPRELAMSYFHEYFLVDGRKTLLAYSKKPFDLRAYDPSEWVTKEEDLKDIEGDLDWAPHSPTAPKSTLKKLRPASEIERTVLRLTDTILDDKRKRGEL